MTSKFEGVLGDPGEDKEAQRRTLAKSKDPSYVQMAVYIPDDLVRQAKVRLILEKKGEDLSDLTARLFQQWMDEQNS